MNFGSILSLLINFHLRGCYVSYHYFLITMDGFYWNKGIIIHVFRDILDGKVLVITLPVHTTADIRV